MPKGSNQKFKLYRLAQIMQEKTDDEHYITMPEIMNELAASENLIAGVRGNYNDWITKYNRYVRHFPNKQILRALGYEKINCHKLDFDVSKDAPTDLFGE